MPLTVEDGTGLSNADSYLSVADADTYHLNFGNAAWALATNDAKEASLRRATQYLDTYYQWAGVPLTYTQALTWPRVYSELPLEYQTWPVKALQNACAELSLRSLSSSLYIDQKDAQVTRRTVGPITTEYANGSNGGQVRFSIIDDMLRVYLGGGGRLTFRIERVS